MEQVTDDDYPRERDDEQQWCQKNPHVRFSNLDLGHSLVAREQYFLENLLGSIPSPTGLQPAAVPTCSRLITNEKFGPGVEIRTRAC